jgi:transcriptional regulator with XRE-family HTH domain
MRINEMIKEKRLELGMTQSFVADFLGVSMQAVSKWEKGTSYPDITLLPILARLLKMDLNTLFDFENDLSEKEIEYFIRQLIENMKEAKDFDETFKMGFEKIKEFPNSEPLARTVVLVLEQFLVLFEIEQPESYQKEIDGVFHRLMHSEDEKMRNETILMRVPALLRKKNYLDAEAAINRLPEEQTDKRILQAEVYLKQKRYADAVDVYEMKLLQLVQELKHALWGMAVAYTHLKKVDMADYFSEAHDRVAEVFGSQEREVLLTRLDMALHRQDAVQAFEYAWKLLDATRAEYIPSTHPFRKIFEKNWIKMENTALEAELVTKTLLNEFKQQDEFEIIRKHPKYEKLLREFER